MNVDELINIFKYGNFEDQNIRIAVIDSESKFLFMSTILVGFSDDYKGVSVYDYYRRYLPQEQIDFIRNGVNKALEGERTESVVVLKNSISRDEINWDAEFIPFTSDDDKRFCITKIRPREINLSTNSTNFLIREMVERSSDFFSVFDENLNFVYVSKVDNGWDNEPLIGRNIDSLISGHILDSFKSRVQKATENPSMVITDVVKVDLHERGEVYYESSMEFHDFGTLGKFYLDRTADVTEKVLKNRELDSQKIMIDKMSKWTALGQMAANIAHEVNNPLAIIELQTQSLTKRGNDLQIDQVLKKIHSIAEQKDRISNIVSSLNIYSQNDRSKREATSFASLIHDSIALFKTALVDEDLKIVFSNDADIDVVNVNSSEVIQVIINLLNNSHDAISNLNEKWIELNLYDNSNFVFLDVVDSGRGIDKQASAKIFDRFYTTKEKTKGTGLGLNICQGIIQDHGGKIYFDNQSEYTTFRINIPKVNLS